MADHILCIFLLCQIVKRDLLVTFPCPQGIIKRLQL